VEKSPLQCIMERLSPLVRTALADTKLHNNKAVGIEIILRQGSPKLEIKYTVVTTLPVLDMDTGLEVPLVNLPRQDTFTAAISRIEIDVRKLLLGQWEVQSKTAITLRIREGAYMSIEPSGSEPRYFAEAKNKKTGIIIGKNQVAVR